MTENYVLENYAASHIHVDEILVIYKKEVLLGLSSVVLVKMFGKSL